MASAVAIATGRPAALTVSIGSHGTALIAAASERLIALQPAVLRDRDPEPLHQMRVAMRRLRTTLQQFAPALELPASLRPARLARHGRRLGLARDLDVLRDRLDRQLLPRLPEAELRTLRPLLRQLRRERRLAGEQLADALRSGSYLRFLAKLQKWLRQPAYTPLADQPLADWLLPLQLPPVSALLCHPGWFVVDPLTGAAPLHDLRKRCKASRYAMENLAAIQGPVLVPWIASLRRVQQLLGDLNDLQVLQAALADQIGGDAAADLPELDALLQQQSQALWHDWQPLAAELVCTSVRRRLLLDLAADPALCADDARADLDLPLNTP